MSPLPYFVDYAAKLGLFLLMGAVCWYISSRIALANLLGVLLKAAVSFAVSNLMVFLLYHKSDEYRYLRSVVLNLRSIVAEKTE